jgi:hypothetical protein
MRFAEIIKLLAAPLPVQEGFLGPLPENTGVPGFRKPNNIYRMVLLFQGSASIQEGQGGTEGPEHWHARTEIPRDPALYPPIQWLSIAVAMLFELDKSFLYTRHGLRSAHEWRLIRHLAGEVCDTMGWSRELHYADFETLWNELGDDAIEWHPDWRPEEPE